MGLFRKAVKSESKLRMAIAGPSGSGKTYTALAIGTALANGGPVAVVDTEHGSASKYADLFDFDVAEMSAPFHPDKFVRAVTEAQEAGYAVVILDSISHAWSGTGGVLDVVDEAAKRSQSRNSFTAWKEGTPLQNRMIDALVQSNIHVIVTMRSKTEYILADNGKGKQEPRKVGMAPVQRDQFEYEFDVVFDMDVENNGIVTKTRCPALTSRVFAKPGADVANILREWLTGAPAAPSKPKPTPASNGTQPATPGVEADVDMGMGDDANPFDDAIWYAATRASLTNGVATLAAKLLDKHRNSSGPASAKQYGFLAGLIDAIVKDATGATDGHKRVLPVVCQTEISRNNPPGADVVETLLKHLPTHVTDGATGEKLPNPDYSKPVSDAMVAIYRAAESVSTPKLIEA